MKVFAIWACSCVVLGSLLGVVLKDAVRPACVSLVRPTPHPKAANAVWITTAP